MSHDVQIEGKALPKGTYGLHMLAGKDEFTLIFSKNAVSWGSYWYNPAEDALRVTVKPEKAEFREWLTYDFIDREASKARVALVWENLGCPSPSPCPTSTPCTWPGSATTPWKRGLRLAAAQQCRAVGARDRQKNLEEATGWAQRSVSAPFVGNENFQTLSTLSGLQRASGKTAEADKTLEKAIAHPTANPIQVHGMGRQLLQAGKKAEALKIFQANAKRFPQPVARERGPRARLRRERGHEEGPRAREARARAGARRARTRRAWKVSSSSTSPARPTDRERRCVLEVLPLDEADSGSPLRHRREGPGPWGLGLFVPGGASERKSASQVLRAEPPVPRAGA